MIHKISYFNEKIDNEKVLKNKLIDSNIDIFNGSSVDNSTDLGGASPVHPGTLQYEHGVTEFNSTSTVENLNMSDLINDILNKKELESKIALDDFTEFLFNKFANVEILTGEELYRQLMLRINSADLPNSSDILKKLTSIFSKTILEELPDTNNLETSKKSAYDKIIHRAEQYISE